MRKIEEKIADAIADRVPFSGGNTLISISGKSLEMRLWGNLILKDTPAGLFVKTEGYNTALTASRLSAALGELASGKVTRKGGRLYYNGKIIANKRFTRIGGKK